MDLFADVTDFLSTFGQKYSGAPRALPPQLAKLRERLLNEERGEYLRAVKALAAELSGKAEPSIDDEVAYNLDHALDALVDLVYVALGTAYLHGFDFNEAWRRVHSANMKKTRALTRKDGKRKSKYDIVKPPGWQPPRHRDLVVNHAHKGRY